MPHSRTPRTVYELTPRDTRFPINVAVGDSLIHGRGVARRQSDDAALFDLGADGEMREHVYSTEDVDAYQSVDVLGRGSYHVVVGNPPYITVKDRGENESYRERYTACSGKYALSVPFAQRFFGLAVKSGGDDRAAGFVGQITANSFMKREFGKKLIEQFFPTVNLTHVIDTSGAFIPGHGTPTVILVGQNHPARASEPIRAVLGVRGEPGQPAEPARGLVWSAIVNQVHSSMSESDWITSSDVAFEFFSGFPWSLSGGGASDVMARCDQQDHRLQEVIHGAIGFASFPGQDDVFFMSHSWFRQRPEASPLLRELVVGEVVRDWAETIERPALVPYDSKQSPIPFDPDSDWSRHLWSMKTILGATAGFDGTTRADSDAPWWTWYRWVAERYLTPLSITFAFVATHNHFVLDRGGKVFKQSAPVIKLPEGASEDEHLALLGVLNSSTACFWLKQVSQAKGGADNSSGGGNRWSPEAWIDRYEFTGTKLQEFPLPAALPLAFGRDLDALAQSLTEQEASAVAAAATPTRARLDRAQADWARLRGQMISVQEELDWHTYGSYGLLSSAEVAAMTIPKHLDAPEIALGERAFEILLARTLDAGEAETAWFTRHGSTPITQIPAHWPQEYRDVVQARIDLIENRRDLALIERPECKRRWAVEPWEKREKAALRTWLLDRAEQRHLWFAMRDGVNDPLPMTVNRLADVLSGDSDVREVAELYATDHLGKRDLPLVEVLASVIAEEHVPYLAALRYKPTGLAKRAEWEHVWDLQREEDRTGERLDIAVPPKYGPTDFVKTSYWSQRGKLDVPKERFISYPGASPDGDDTLLLGWAGWDHKEQAQALVTLIRDRADDAGWGADRLTPLLAGLAEVMPWVRQWHGEYDAEWEAVPAEELGTFLEAQRTSLGLTVDALAGWRPEPATRGRRRTALVSAEATPPSAPE
jgi:hypothetical protein